MPQRAHLRRLDQVWVKDPVYFLTTCTIDRKPLLTDTAPAKILFESWQAADRLHGWAIGRFVIMPDHEHFFARARHGSKSLTEFMRDWKKWTGRQICQSIAITPPLWQPEFFDHLLRSELSYAEKWAYVQANPVRAGLVDAAAAWPHAGEITPLTF